MNGVAIHDRGVHQPNCLKCAPDYLFCVGQCHRLIGHRPEEGLFQFVSHGANRETIGREHRRTGSKARKCREASVTDSQADDYDTIAFVIEIAPTLLVSIGVLKTGVDLTWVCVSRKARVDPVPPLSAAGTAIVYDSIRRNDGVGLLYDLFGRVKLFPLCRRAIYLPLSRRVSKPDLGISSIRPDVAHRTQRQECIFTDEVVAFSFQRVRAVVANRIQFGFDAIFLVTGAAEDLQVPSFHGPLDVRWGQPIFGKQSDGQWLQLAIADSHKHFEEGSYGTNAITVAEHDLIWNFAAGYFAAGIINDQGFSRTNSTKTEGVLRQFKVVVLQRGWRRSQTSNRQGRQDAEFGDHTAMLLRCGSRLGCTLAEVSNVSNWRRLSWLALRKTIA